MFQRHNEVRDSFQGLSSLVWSKAKQEPVVQEADNMPGTPALIADLSVRGVWMLQAETLFDVRVVDTDAQSYHNCMPKEVLQAAEKNKRDKYVTACEDR